MNTGRLIMHYRLDGTNGLDPYCYCDLCGWADTVNWFGSPEDEYHFCHRHGADEVRRWWRGEIPGYDEGQQEFEFAGAAGDGAG